MKKGSEFSRVSASPWLIYTHGKGKWRKYQTVCSVNPDEKPYLESIPCLSGSYIVGSSRGWLILRSHFNKIIYLWDPETSNLIKLPPITSPNFTRDIKIYTCILTDNPNNRNNSRPCIVLLFCNYVVFSYRLSSRDQQTEANNWMSHELKLKGIEATITHAVIDENNKVIYGLCYARRYNNNDVACRRNLVSINVDEDENVVTLGPRHLALPIPDRSTFPYYNKWSHSLIETCGSVYVIVVFWISKSGSEYERMSALKIWRLDFETLAWVEDPHSMDDRAFYIHNSRTGSSEWSWANDGDGGGVEPNSVYLLYNSKHNTVYHYKLHDHSVTPLLPCPDLLHSSDAPAWIALSHHHHRSSVGEYSKPQAPIRSNQKQHSDVHVDVDVLDPLDSKKPFDHYHKTPDDAISSLPSDVIQFISKRLYLFDYLSFRRVCKSLRSQLPLSQCRIHNQLLPLFLFSKNQADGSCQIMDPTRTTDPCFITIPFPFKFEKFVDFSKNGWLLFGMRGSSLNYFNIFSKVTGSFPTLDYMEIVSSLGFSTSPTSSNCLTVGIRGVNGIVLVSYHRYGENEWTTQQFIDGRFKFQPWTSSPVFVDGAFYFLDRSGHVGVFELKEDQEPRMMFYDKPEMKTDYFDSNHLVECDGQILSVFVGDMGKWVQVFKLDKLKKVWGEVKEVGDNILFINHSASISAAAPESGMGNRIYLPRMYEDRMVYYSMETRKFHACGTNHPFHDLYGTAEQLRCSWV